MGPRSVVSGRRGAVESPGAARETVVKGQPIPSPVLLLETMVGYVVASMSATGQRLADELDGIEDRVIDGRNRDDRRRLGPIRRSAVRLHRQLLGLAAVFHRLEDDDTAQHLHGPGVWRRDSRGSMRPGRERFGPWSDTWSRPCRRRDAARGPASRIG